MVTFDTATPEQLEEYRQTFDRDAEEMVQRYAYQTYPFEKVVQYEKLGYLDPRFRPRI